MPITTTTAAMVTAVASIGGLAMTTVGSIVSGQQQQKTAEAQAQGQRAAYSAQADAARRNQQVAEENAQATEAAGAYAEKQARLKALKLQGTQTVAYAKSGVLPEGSPLDVMAETAALEEQDILATRYNYQVQAARYRSQGDFYGFEGGRQDRMAGNVNTPSGFMTNSLLKAGTSILTVGDKLANRLSGKTTYDPDIPGSAWGSL